MFCQRYRLNTNGFWRKEFPARMWAILFSMYGMPLKKIKGRLMKKGIFAAYLFRVALFGPGLSHGSTL